MRQIRRVVYGRVFCNSVVVSGVTVSTSCGSSLANGAAIEFDGPAPAARRAIFAPATSSPIARYEQYAYAYSLKLTACAWTSVRAISGYDAPSATGTVLIANSTSFMNHIDGALPAGTSAPYLVDNSGNLNPFRSSVTRVDRGGLQHAGADAVQRGVVRQSEHLQRLCDFAGGLNATTIQPGQPTGASYGLKQFRVLRCATDTVDPGNEVFAVDIGGGLYVGAEQNAGNITNSLSTGASWSSNGRTWICNGTGSQMEIASGSGGSYLKLSNYAVQFYQQDRATKVAQIGPNFGGNGYAGIGFGSSLDAALFRSAAGVLGFTGVPVMPLYTVSQLCRPPRARSKARARRERTRRRRGHRRVDGRRFGRLPGHVQRNGVGRGLIALASGRLPHKGNS